MALGPVGCPLVAETAAAGLVLPFQTSVQGARGWIGRRAEPAPSAAAAVGTGGCRGGASLEGPGIAQPTADRIRYCRDRGCPDHPVGGAAPVGECGAGLEAIILQVDPRLPRARGAGSGEAGSEGDPVQHGLRTFIARGEAGDVALMLAFTARWPKPLPTEGDEDPLARSVVEGDRSDRQLRPASSTCWLVITMIPIRYRDPWERVAAHTPTDRSVGRRSAAGGVGDLSARKPPPAASTTTTAAGTARRPTTRPELGWKSRRSTRPTSPGSPPGCVTTTRRQRT